MEQLTLIENEQITPRSGAKKYKENVLERKEREHIDENIQRLKYRVKEGRIELPSFYANVIDCNCSNEE